MNEPIKVFLSYSHKDEELRQELISHLSGLQHQGLIEPWHDRNISAGSEWADQIDQNLEQADIILFLVSADFINSRYCYSIEMKRALDRHRAKTACTIPVIIRDCDWKSTDLHQLNGIPRDNRHVTGWGDRYARDSAWTEISEEIGKVARQIRGERNTQQIIAAQKAKAIQDFRAKAESFYKDGAISPGERALLDLERKRLGLETEAEEILAAVKTAYQQCQADLEQYRQTLIAEWAEQDELRAEQWELLQQLQTALGISDPEVEQIKQKVLADRAKEPKKAQETANTQTQETELQRQQETEARLSREAAEQQRTLEAQRQQAAENLQRKQDLESAEQQRRLEAQRQQEAENPQRKQDCKAAEQLSRDAATHNANLNLQTFSFEVVLLDDAGKERKRTTEQAQYFAEVLAPGIDLHLVSIPGGSFQMGSPDGEGSDDERPQHLVDVAPFFMGMFPVTQAQWRVVAGYPQEKQVLNTEPSRFKGDKLPVEMVSWDDAVEFCARLSCKTGHIYRLPSEAEWEYACRANTKTSYHFGNEVSQDVLNNPGARKTSWFSKQLPYQTSEAGNFGVANQFGLYDMHGNVWEWCLDLWHNNYTGAPHDGSAWVNDDNSPSRLLRGGSWYFIHGFCRSACRSADSSDNRTDFIGFRVVLVPS
jgi:formylglycine-generating enzyme required for sulfatase activity